MRGWIVAAVMALALAAAAYADSDAHAEGIGGTGVYKAMCTRTVPPRNRTPNYHVDWQEGSQTLFVDTLTAAPAIRYHVLDVNREAWPLVLVSGTTPAGTRFTMSFINHDYHGGTDVDDWHSQMINIDAVYALPDDCAQE